MEQERWLTDHRKFQGDKRLKNRLVFQRRSDMRCIYCGGRADTREHCPSKMLVSGLEDVNLPVLPACHACNNSFSTDELYTKYFIQYLEKWNKNTLPSNADSDEVNKREAFDDVNIFIDSNGLKISDRLKRTLVKFAIGHCVYESSEVIDTDSTRLATDVRCSAKRMMDEYQWMSLQEPVLLDNRSLPGMGSRQYTEVFVIEHQYENGFVAGGAYLNWIDIQPGIYSYIAFLDKDHEIVVNIIIRDSFWVSVRFTEE